MTPHGIALHTWLSSYTCHSPKEQQYVHRMNTLLKESEDPFSRKHFIPGHFTASSFVLSPDAHSLLLIYHKKLKMWLQPGGHIEATDPTLAHAFIREVEEETSLKLPLPSEPIQIFDVDIHHIPHIGIEPAHEHFDLRLLFHSNSSHIQANTDADEAKWVPLSDLDSVHTDDSVRRAVQKIRLIHGI